MPIFQPNRYSLSVSRPIPTTTSAHSSPRRRARGPARSSVSIHSAAPMSTKATAELGFVAGRLSKTLFNNGRSSSQPSNTRQPIKATRILAIWDQILSERIRVLYGLIMGPTPNFGIGVSKDAYQKLFRLVVVLKDTAFKRSVLSFSNARLYSGSVLSGFCP